MTDQHDRPEHPHRLTEELHNIPQRLKEIPYNLEQRPPRKPSFLTVVILSGICVIIVFIIALIVLHNAHGRMESPFRSHPSSQLVLPATSPSTLT